VIPVYDLGNTKRLLGYLRRTPSVTFRQGDYLQMAVIPSMPLRPTAHASEFQSVRMKTVSFTMSYRYTEGGWNVEAAVLAEAPLQDLLALREFILPGEHLEDAAERQYRSSFR
jgi:hypothetical protein